MATTLNLSALTAEDTEIAKVARQSKSADSPFVQWLTESQAQETGKAVTVPGSQVREVVYLIRAAANHLGIGSRVVVLNRKGEVVSSEPSDEIGENGKPKVVQPATIAGRSPRQMFTVQFAAKARRKSKDATEDTAEDTDEDE